MRILAAAALIAALAVQQPTFKSQVQSIEIDAIVTDHDGRFVRDLTQDDFQILEAGKPQTIRGFTLVDLPIASTTAMRAAEPPPDVASNDVSGPGRIYLIVMDSFHVAASRTRPYRQVAREFVEKYLQPGDRAAVAHVGYPSFNQDFTDNRALLIASINKAIGEKTASAAVAALNADSVTGAGGDIEAGARDNMAERTTFALGELTKYLASLHGQRKALVLFSEGLDVDVLKDPQSEIFAKLRQAYVDAARSNVSFYTVDPRGAGDVGDELMQVGGLPDGGEPPGRALLGELAFQQNSMRNLAEVTGGLTSVGSNDFDRAFTRIVEDNSTYYLLGYEPSDDVRDGKYRSIKVKVTRPGLTVRSRNGYYAETPKEAKASARAAPIDAMLSEPLSTPGLRLHLQPAVLEPARDGKTWKVHVTLEIDGRDLTFDARNGASLDDLDVAYGAIDHGGAVRVSARDVIGLRPTDRGRGVIADRGIRYVADLTLAPGRYQLRVAVRERSGLHAGSVYADVEVPSADRLVNVGDVLVTSVEAGRTLSVNGQKDSLKGRLPSPATAVRSFASSDTLAALVAMTSRQPEAIELTTRLLAADGTEVFHAQEMRNVSAAPAVADYLVRIPLTSIAPGSYRMFVIVRPPGEPSITRSVSVAVW